MPVFKAQKCVHNTKCLFPFFLLLLTITTILSSKCTLFQMRKNFQNDAAYYQS